MQFPSPAFAIFMLAFLPLWHALGARPGARAFLSIAASVVFLALSSPLAAECAACMGMAFWVVASNARQLTRLGLAGCVALLLAPLAYFKYSAWVGGMAGWPETWLWTRGSPLGLSFYTFSGLAWVFAEREGSWLGARRQALAGAFFFPSIGAGPIVRPIDCAAQLAAPLSPPSLAWAASPFLLGLALKLAVSTRLGAIADAIFADPQQQSLPTLALAIHAYAGQLYADFAGYSLMAIGVGRALGVELPSNFAAPYLAPGIGEFWRRWHQSLSRFWRERIYIPLGGNRVGRARELFNLVAVMLLCGLWHGAGAGFILWGAIHGAMLCAERAWSWTWAPSLPRVAAVALTFEAVCWSWLPFRLSDWDALSAVAGMAADFSGRTLPAWTLLIFGACWVAIAAEHLFKDALLSAGARLGAARPLLFIVIACAVAAAIIELSPEGIPPFIYANF